MSFGPQQPELMNTPLGGHGTSSVYMVNGKGKLAFRGTFDAQTMHQAIETAVTDPRNSQPGKVSIAGFYTDKQGILFVVVSPVRQMKQQGGNQWGGQHQQQWGNAGSPQQQYQQQRQQQWGQGGSAAPVPAPGPQQQWAAPSGQDFQERYSQPEEPKKKAATTKKAPAKKAASRKQR